MKYNLIVSAFVALVIMLGGCGKDPQPNHDNPDGPINSNEIFYVDGERFVVLEQESGQRLFFQLLPSNEAVMPPYYSPGYPYAKNGAQFHYQNEYDGDIVVPETFTLDGTTYTVTRIDRCAFDGCEELNSIIIPNTVKKIGDKAFCHCHSLSHVQLPSTLDSIQAETFYLCESLRSIQFPESLKYIGFNAFIMSGLEELNFTKYVKLDCGAFLDCPHLKTVTLPDGMDTICRDLFANCEELSSVFIPQSLKVIDEDAFFNTNLSSVELPESLISIESEAFSYTPLTAIELPNSLQFLSGFSFCSQITEVVIPESVVVLGSWAFGGCSNLKTITCLATNPPEIFNMGAFEETELSVIYVPEESLEKYLSDSGWSEYADIIQPIPYF
ncbi:MAG: leucine-rich repeat domain-containing protein [Bacteroidales bacterium]|nr:leucine-rich repeat domain-containing protein [Bacteroidales bacterium]